MDDLERMRRIARGDQSAYRAMVDAYLARITRFAARILVNQSEAEDVAQEAFLKLWTHAEQFTPRAQPKTWLYRIAHNLCIDRLRKRKPGDDAEWAADEQERPSALLERKRTAQAVERALATLPERQRAAITLVHYDGMSGAEACEVLEVSLPALESLLARARRSLREQLQGLDTVDGDVA